MQVFVNNNDCSVACDSRNCHSALDAESRPSTILDSRFRGNDIRGRNDTHGTEPAPVKTGE